MKKLIFFILLLPTLVLADDFILVKEVWGKVNLIYSEKKKEPLKVYSKLEKSQSIELVDESSKIWIRDKNNRNLIVEWDEKNQYSFTNLISLFNESYYSKSEEKSFINQFWSLISLSDNESSNKINGMIVSPKTGVSRNIDANIVQLNELFIIEGMTFSFDFNNIIFNSSNNDYTVKIKDRWSKKILYNLKIDQKYFELDVTKNLNSLGVNWILEISNSGSSKTIVADLSSIYINSKSLNLINELKEKAIAESEGSECVYQIIFLESLLSKGLHLNARYYLNYFISKSQNSYLIKFKKRLYI